MNDLPNSDDPQGQPSAPTATPSGNKEMVGSMDRPEGLQDSRSPEVELPKEVVSAGVRVQPTSIPIPAPVAQMGVQPAGKNIPVAQVATVALPISDEQIAQGLHQSITSSWLWLAHWCVKRLKQIHFGIQSIQGKTVRVKI